MTSAKILGFLTLSSLSRFFSTLAAVPLLRNGLHRQRSVENILIFQIFAPSGGTPQVLKIPGNPPNADPGSSAVIRRGEVGKDGRLHIAAPHLPRKREREDPFRRPLFRNDGGPVLACP